MPDDETNSDSTETEDADESLSAVMERLERKQADLKAKTGADGLRWHSYPDRRELVLVYDEDGERDPEPELRRRLRTMWDDLTDATDHGAQLDEKRAAKLIQRELHTHLTQPAGVAGDA